MWTNWPQSRTTAFFPLVLWAVERVPFEDRTWRSVVPLPFALGALVLGGFPALVVYLAYVVVLWVLGCAGGGCAARPAGAPSWSSRVLRPRRGRGAGARPPVWPSSWLMGSWLGEVSLGERSPATPVLDLRPRRR